MAGFQVPGIPFVEVAGRSGALLFWQIDPIAAKSGLICGLTVIAIVDVVAHCPVAGVKI